MNYHACRFVPTLLIAFLCSCGGGGGGGVGAAPPSVVSSGSKIFATSQTHSADFLHDTSLSGTTAIEKADNFCQTDSNRPDSGTYKAILVDGVNRDALVPLDWVLKPDTTYYQVDKNVQIGTTTSAALFGENLSADIHDSFGVSGGNNSNTSTVWTGFGDGISFTTGPLTCNGWSYGGSDGTYAPYGISYGTDGTEWYTNGGQVCSLPSRLYCAEQ
jgi:trimeric autotransporter adhesin